MDKTETYIKMRVKAIPELGMGTPPTKSPPCFITDNVWVDAVGNWYAIYHQGKEDAVIGCQLERQDQLQEMLGILHDNFCDRNLGRFCSWIGITGGPDKFYNLKYKMQFTSMEQLWLAFVMKEKFRKVWTGEDWRAE